MNEQEDLTIIVKKTDENAELPLRKHMDDAGADLHANEDVVIPPGEWKLVGTGVRVILPVNTVGYITPRSGLAVKSGISVLNTPGTIDAGFRGELKVCLINHSKEDYLVTHGNRIAQLVVQPVLFPTFKEVVFTVDEEDAMNNEAQSGKTRGASGFGSTGN